MVKDFQIDETGDLKVLEGDFAVDLSDQQHVEDIIESFQGWWKEFVQVGVGLFSYLNSSSDFQNLELNIKSQLTGDGYTVNNPRVKFENEKLIIKPNAVRNDNI